MNLGKTQIGLALVLALGLLASSIEAAQDGEAVRVASLVGRATVERADGSSAVDAGTTFQAGDVLRVASGSRATVRFVDESTLSLIGPSTLCFKELAPDGRRVLLESGVVSEAYMQGVALEVQTPYDVSLVLQNATGFARVAPGSAVAFQKQDGDLAQVFHQGELRDLTGTWTLNVREGDVTTGAVANLAGESAGPMRRVVLGGRTIAWAPPADFKVETRSEGGLRLTYTGSDFGVVKVGPHSTLFFLSQDQSITFDENGNVVQFDGISHVYHPLFDVNPYDEPVENAADASVSNPSRR